MTIKAGDKMPEGESLPRMSKEGPQKMTTEQLFAGRPWCCFPCRALHADLRCQAPAGLRDLADQIKSKGVDTIACTAVNDVFGS